MNDDVLLNFETESIQKREDKQIPFAEIPCDEISLLTESPELFVTGWNRQLQRPVNCEVAANSLMSSALRQRRTQIVSVPIPKRMRVESKSWFFYPIQQKGISETEKEATNESTSEMAEMIKSLDLMPPENMDDNDLRLEKLPLDSLTRIRVPRDAIKITDRLGYILQPPIESILHLPTLDMPFAPFPYQRQGIAFLYSAHFAILADEMGLGKTMQAITTIRLLLRTGEMRNVLLVCPKPLLPNWKREFELWAPEINVQVIDGSPARRKWLWQLPGFPVRIANYELLHRDREYYDSPETGNGTVFDLVVLDESQRIKNQGSSTAQAARAIPRLRNWALTGTPVENSQEDLVGIFEFLQPGFLASGLRPSEVCNVVGEHILRRTKDKVLKDMPPKLMRDAIIELTPEQEATYRLAEDEGVLRLTEAGEGVSIPQVFELIIRLKQICNFDPVTGESSKLERLVADLEEVAESGRKAIIFSQWVETLMTLRQHLKPFGTAEYHGQIPSSKREEMIRKFRDDKNIHVILMSYGAGSVGLNLQFAEYVFLFDRWWNPAVEDQAINRAHRIGVAGPVTVTRFIATNTVEERIDRVLQEKRELSELILSGARGLNMSTGLNQDDIFGLFNLRIPSKQKKIA
ncbi:MAG: DEAD/DEAH box helicase [Thermoguttaceae bacterium]